MHYEFEAYRYKTFWVKDRIKNGYIEVQSCPTSQMLADFFSKPVQGLQRISDLFKSYNHDEERVGKYDKK